VFVNDDLYHVAELLNRGVIDIAQLHGSEDAEYIGHLRQLTGKPVIRAFRIKTAEDIAEAEKCTADRVLLDSGAGTGEVFDWKLIKNMKRPYFLAGGLSPDNVENAVEQLSPYAVDVSSGIETDGVKDKAKMAAFAAAVRGEKI
jgi:phosphoribosylanthranilate isomerase